MNVFLYKGNEAYLINNKIDMLIKESKANEFNISSYDCSEVNLGLAIQDAMTLPFLGETKVVIIKNPVFLTNEKQLISHDINSLINYINNPLDQTYLIINAVGLRLSEKLEVVKLLNKKAVVNETKEIDEVEFKGWIKRQCDIAFVKINEEAVKAFYIAVGKDLINAKNELDKMILYVGHGGTITNEVVSKLTSRGLQANIYSLTDAILKKNKENIISVYNNLISYGIDIYVLINLTTKAMKDNLVVNLLLQEGATQADIASKMGVSPNRAYYLVKDARELDVENIKEYVIKLSELDYNIKSGQVDPKMGFEYFLFGLK